MTKIIGISGISGAGKSVITKELSIALGSTMLFWDEFDKISEYPKDYIKWYQSDRTYDAWKYDSLVGVLKILKSGETVISPATNKELIPTKYVIFDAPLGRKHKATGQYIDYSIYLNTPLDIALARRLLRDYQDESNLEPSKILEDLNFYLTTSRPLYVMDYEWMNTCDLIVDGNLSLNDQVQLILKSLERANEWKK